MGKDLPVLLLLLRSKMKRALIVFAALLVACLTGYKWFAFRQTAPVRNAGEMLYVAEFSLGDFTTLFVVVIALAYLALILVSMRKRSSKNWNNYTMKRLAISDQKTFLWEIVSCMWLLFLFWMMIILAYGVIDLLNSIPRYYRNGSQDAVYSLLFNKIYYGLIPIHSPLLWLRNLWLTLCGGAAIACLSFCRGKRVVLILSALALILLPFAIPGQFSGTATVPIDSAIGKTLGNDRDTMMKAVLFLMLVTILSSASALFTGIDLRKSNNRRDED